MRICRCTSFICIVCGLLLLVIFVALQTKTTNNQANPQPYTFNTGTLDVVPTTIYDACLSCHAIDETLVASTANNLDTKFVLVGQRLLNTPHANDQRFTEPVWTFWQVHQQFNAIRANPDRMSEALAILDQVEWQISRIHQEIENGRIDTIQPQRELSPSAHLKTLKELLSVDRQSSTLLPMLTAYDWPLVENHAPVIRYMFRADSQRGPPAAMVVDSCFVKLKIAV